MKTFLRNSALLVVLLTIWSCTKSTDTIRAQHKNIVEAVYAAGTIHPLNEYKAFANASGILRNVLVHEGDSVAGGQLLFEVESRDPQLRTQSAKEALDFARANADEHSAALDELRANLDAARARWQSDSSLAARTKLLFTHGSTTSSELERVQRAADASSALFVAAEKKLLSTRQSLANQVRFAQKQFELASTTSKNFAVLSRFEGQVYALYREEGEMVTSSQPVALLGDARAFVLRLVIDAADVLKLKVGQRVLYSLDAFPDSSFRATVLKVYPVLDNETQSFRVDARCDERPAVPFVGTQVQANIIITEKEHALVIPRSYLQANNKVLVKDGSSSRFQDVQIGISNLEYVEIRSGITEQDQLLRK